MLQDPPSKSFLTTIEFKLKLERCQKRRCISLYSMRTVVINTMVNKPILIVDDEPIVRESIRDWLKASGYEVETADSGEAAMELVEKKDYSVVVMDVRLPGRTGISVLKDIKALKPQIKSIVITAYPSEEMSAEARKFGAVDYLIKPVNPDDLEKLINATISMI